MYISIYMMEQLEQKVIEVGNEVKARKIENHGILSSRKGVNFPNTVIDIDVITKKMKKI